MWKKYFWKSFSLLEHILGAWEFVLIKTLRIFALKKKVKLYLYIKQI